MLSRNASARVKIQVRGNSGAASAALRNPVVALEPFTANKAMGRVLLRRNGETIAAGIVLSVLS
jgi:elongation factor 1 alpha-like protein